MVVVPGEDGDFAAMFEHAPLITYLRPGKLEVVEAEKKEEPAKEAPAEKVEEAKKVEKEELKELKKELPKTHDKPQATETAEKKVEQQPNAPLKKE